MLNKQLEKIESLLVNAYGYSLEDDSERATILGEGVGHDKQKSQDCIVEALGMLPEMKSIKK